MTAYRWLDHLHDRLERAENECDMLRHALDLADRYGRETAIDRIEQLLDAATRELHDIEDMMPPDERPIVGGWAG